MKAAGFFGDGNGKMASRFFADFGALGDKTQAVKVHVRAASKAYHFFISQSLRAAYSLSPATAKAPAGSKITRVSRINL